MKKRRKKEMRKKKKTRKVRPSGSKLRKVLQELKEINACLWVNLGIQGDFELDKLWVKDLMIDVLPVLENN
ncbi:Uncharacterized protein TCM_028252 [Theobroma cacao]|uniref:Uncharacterized protein n=1 Tax=Theobroma cacao TaxID=3641 RepID=A0A061GBF5_THECC|nr:Uncharacterized protein TCM_028252 [Theobroma cacao]